MNHINNCAVFLDRDGVLIEEKSYLSTPEEVKLIPGAIDALRLIRNKGFKVIVVTNQSGVARGFFEESDVLKVNNKIRSLLSQYNIFIDAFYYCPHHPDGKIKRYAITCDCRKPKPGMILRAAKDFSIDIAGSCMIGDKFSDIEAGMNAGCKCCILVATGYGIKYKDFPLVRHFKKDILDAVRFFFSHLT